MKENAIITFAFGYHKKDVEIFLESCISSNVSADIYLFAGKNYRALRNELNHYAQVKVIRYKENIIPKIIAKLLIKIPLLGTVYASTIRLIRKMTNRKWLHSFAIPLVHFMSRRFFALDDFIKKHHYKNYLFADIRDVLFQDDPFSKLQFNEIHSGVEPILIGDDLMNRKWADFALNSKHARALYPKEIVCAGVILGSAWAFHRYLKEFIELTYQSLPSTIGRLGADQAIHSYLFHFGMNEVEKVIHNNQNGQIVTLHHEKIDHYRWKNNHLLHEDGRNISIVHQYDRHADLDKKFRDIYLYPRKLKLVG